MAMTTIPLGLSPANPARAPRVPAGPNSLAARAAQGLANDAEPTRRGILGALAGVPIAAAFGTIALPAMASTSSDWPQAYAHFKAADARWDRHTADVYNPAVDEIDAFAPAPDLTWKVTAKSGQTATYRFNPRNPDEWDGNWITAISKGGLKKKEEYFTWLARQKLAAERVGFDAISSEDDRLCQLLVAARKGAVATPTGSISELAEKAAFILDQYEDSIDEQIFDVILADLRRLAAKEG